MLLLLFACGDPKVATDTSPETDTDTDTDSDTDTDTDTDADTVLPDGLNGEVPEEPVPLPTFTARAQDGTTRTEADLLDHRTVMWFYPAANTAG